MPASTLRDPTGLGELLHKLSRLLARRAMG
jgi:hypothetical protein